MRKNKPLSQIRTFLLLIVVSLPSLVTSQNVYDTYNPYNSPYWPASTYIGTNTNSGWTGEYQLFTNDLMWSSNLTANNWSISYKIEPVSFPFVADCSNGDCGNGSSNTRNLNLPNPYNPNDWIFRRAFDEGLGDSDPTNSGHATLSSALFTQDFPPGSPRDILPHTILKHTYYLHCGVLLSDPVIDSFSFVIDHTRGIMSRYPFLPTNTGGTTAFIDIAIHPWVIYPVAPFWDTPPQTDNFLHTIDYFLYPDAHYFPGICAGLTLVPDPNNSGEYSSNANGFGHPSPYSLIGFMLGDQAEAPFAGYDNTLEEPMEGAMHHYFIDYDLDLRLINPSERIIYNPSYVDITTAPSAPLIFPSGYTFQTVGAIYPTAQEVADADPNNMHSDPREVAVHGDALHLTDNPDTEIDDTKSIYTVTSGSKLIIESCVNIWDATIRVESGGTLEYWPDELYGNYVLDIDAGATVIPHYGTSAVACPYLCYEQSQYNADLVTISSSTSWTTTNLSTLFPGIDPWASVESNTVRLIHGIIIESGNTLTIGAGVNVEFGPEAKVIVEEGAKLIVNGTSTARCKFIPTCQKEWQGIQVLGDRTQGQGTITSTPQGYLELNYCNVEHARDAITVGDYYDAGKEGGIVHADHCSFLNNVRDAQFLSYRNFGSSNHTLNNLSHFNDCEFRTTEYFYDPSLNLDNGFSPTAGIAHITMCDVKNVQINDCVFANDNPGNYKPHLRGVGIFGIDAGLRLYATNANTFEGLSDGVWMQSSGFAAGAIHVAGCTFNNNIHSVVMEGTVFSLIYDNDIDVPESSQYGYSSSELERGYDKPVGVYMLGATDFRIEDNNFNVGDNSSQITPQNDCSDCSYNIVVHESAVANPFTSVAYGSGTVYHNVIDHASMGIQVQGNNGYNGSTYGLQVMCNDFDEMLNYDFILNGDNNVQSDLTNQGICNAAHPEWLAGNNYLSSCTSVPDNQIYADLAFVNVPVFDYHEMPITNFPACFNVNVQTCATVAEENPCSSRIATRSYYSPILLNYSTATTNHEATKTILETQIDGWKQIPPEELTDDIYATIYPYSPWLSDSTLLSLFDPTVRPRISDDHIVEILIANSGLSPAVYDAFLNADPAIESPYYEDLINAQDSEPSERIQAEQEWATWVHEADLAANEITEYALRTDSLDQGVSALLGAKLVPELQNLFILQLADRDFEGAENTLTNILEAQNEEQSSWTALAAISLVQQQDNRSWLSATEEEIAVANDIYDIDHERAINARVITSYYRGFAVARSPFPLQGSEESRLQGEHSTETNVSPQQEQALQIFPNPTSGFATVYTSEEFAKDGCVLMISNPMGQVIDRIEIAGTSPIQLDLNQYAEGMLYLRLWHQDACLASEKLLIIR